MNALNLLNRGLQGIVLAGALGSGVDAQALEEKFAVSVYGEAIGEDDHDDWVNYGQLEDNDYDIVRLDFAGEDSFSYERALLNQIKRVYRKKGPIPVIMFNMHGDQVSMYLNGGAECLSWVDNEWMEKEDCYIDMWDTDFFEELKEYMDPNGIIALSSCSTGKGDANLASRINEITGLPVYAESEDGSKYLSIRANFGVKFAEKLPYYDFDEEGNVERVNFYRLYLDEDEPKKVWIINGEEFNFFNVAKDITAVFDEEIDSEEKDLEEDLLEETHYVQRGRNYFFKL